MATHAFATLVTSDHYLPGALTLAAALNDVHSAHDFTTVVLVTPETVAVESIKLLRKAFDLVIGVEVIEQLNPEGLALLGRPDLYTVLTKLHVFRLTQFEKVIFLDADVLPIRPLSHLFNIPHEFAAVPDVGWPDIFNSGVMLLTPGEDKFNDLMNLVKSKGSWDGGDQGVLNEWRGENWHRLSFTYNTTPTAAYTYAPAYERFGSQISAIHFIGPNKPWNSIPSRPPFTSYASTLETTTDTDTSQRSYAYDNLLDRWFSVYDKHYRQPAPVLPSDFGVQRYENVWNVATPAPQIRPASGGTFGLEDLRRVAVEGVYAAASDVRQGEGEYKSMPLEGRVDLMRPRREEPEPELEYVELEGRAPAGARTPSITMTSPEGKIIDLPSDPSPPYPHSHHPGSPSGGSEHWQPPPPPPPAGQHSPGTHGPGPAPQSQPSHDPQQYHDGSSQSQPQSQTQSQPGGQPSQGEQQHQSQYAQPQPQYPQQNLQFEHVQLPPPSSPTGPPPSSQPHASPQPTHAPPRHYSPPLMSWNPAVEPPPKAAPPVSAFPTDAYFPNVWDMSAGAAKLHSSLTGQDKTDAGTFFQPPPQTQIPQRLIDEGHYVNVTGPAPPQHEQHQEYRQHEQGQQQQDHQHQQHQHQHQQHDQQHQQHDQQHQQHDQQHQPQQHQQHQHQQHQQQPPYHPPPPPPPSGPRPDFSKVSTVFPWEQKPRHVPSRRFPDSDPPPPGLPYIEHMPPAPEPEPEPQPAQEPAKSPPKPPGPLSPPVQQNMPLSVQYSNVWDTVPSITKYAARLVKPTMHQAPPSPVKTGSRSPRGRRRTDSFRSWEEQGDATSMDGDVEDEMDEDEADGRKSGRYSSSERSDVENGGRRGSKNGTPGTRTPTGTRSPKAGKYRSYGVQTIAKETKSQGVQCSILVAGTKTEPAHPHKPAGPGKQHQHQHYPHGHGHPHTYHHRRGGHTSPAHVQIPADPASGASTKLSSPESRLPSGMISPRLHDMYTFGRATSPSALLSPAVVNVNVTDPMLNANAASLRPSSSKAGTTSPPTAKVPFPASAPATVSAPKPTTRRPIPSDLLPPTGVARASSTETVESTIGPASPVDVPTSPQQRISAMKPAGRQWNPATGVDLFKRGSEEVLARFLRMESWDEDRGAR